MFCYRTISIAAAASFILVSSVIPGSAERVDRGNQVIDGTRVNTAIYHERGYAIFSNDCGSQRLTQRQLQSGAKPTDIIPCPRRTERAIERPSPSIPSTPSASSERRMWAAVAAGLSNGFLGIGSKVGAGIGKNYSTRAEAESAALSKCRESVSSCQVVSAWNSGCYFITVSQNASNVAWGSGPTAQDAYNECYSRVEGGNCSTEALGACYPE